MTGTAHDDWVRAYTLAEGGHIDINNSRGAVDVQGVDGSTVEVRVERIVHAVTDAAAAEILPRLVMKEDVAPDKVVIGAEPLGGIVIGVSVEMRYHVRAPKTAALRVRNVGGLLNVKDVGGHVVLNGANGGLVAEGLGGGIETRWVNGPVSIALASVGSDLVDVRVTNGGLTLTIPERVNANLMASATNGRVEVRVPQFEPLGDQTPRRVRGRFNAGGTPIELVTVNGSITVESPVQ
jgi:hypothetical protein